MVASGLERSDRIIHPKLSSEPGVRGELPATSIEVALVDKCSQAVWSEATELSTRNSAASPACAASCLPQAQKWLWSINALKRFGAKRQNERPAHFGWPLEFARVERVISWERL